MAESNMNLISCRLCGVIMVKLSRDICQKCHQEEEELFLKVRDYLRSNPGVTINDVAKALEATDEQIEYFIKSGRLERVGVKISHQCQTCKKTINSGLICHECSKELKEQVKALQGSVARAKESGDYVLSGKKKHKSDRPPGRPRKDG